ncbi:RluA family pseudouridine synthase [Collinsella tanakaei]|uniref:RluA family pseudouridine synthase n=1 Tax=Collinsella tanakaei TaxID=626935 RepID=UPI001958DAD1|nr:RluA family pseudouridine synthase [Collinsella tanakaei]MBM6867880.1 RluA family pseudouridine synthase [Collinsella tanakaei]
MDGILPAILFESDTLLAVDKPAGIIVHGDGTGATTLTDQVRALLRSRADMGTNPDELQALQRLDRETSGIVLFSLRKSSQATYDRLIAEHGIDKRYLAIVNGAPTWRTRTFTDPIGRDRHDARRMRASRTGKAAMTHARVLDTRRIGRKTLTLLEVRIETGRKHQIRVHLSHAGLPIHGDDLYGTPASDGLMLHAHRLSFIDPIDSARVSIIAPAPARMRRLFPRALDDSR